MCSFIKSAVSEKDWCVDYKTEICFIGRSNVGKSSLINALANKQIAKNSKTPGCTKTINFYDFGKFRLVDLPGYGYANVSKKELGKLNDMIVNYLNNRSQLAMIAQIVDVNVITNQDLEISSQLCDNRWKHILICNKIDKLSGNQLFTKKQKIEEQFYKNCILFFVSAKRKTNVKELLGYLKKNK